MDLPDLAKFIAKRRLNFEDTMTVVANNLKPVTLPIDSDPETDPELSERHQRRQKMLALQRKEREEELADRREFWAQRRKLAQTNQLCFIEETPIKEERIRLLKTPKPERVKIIATPKKAFSPDQFTEVFGEIIKMLSNEELERVLKSLKKWFNKDLALVENLSLVAQDFSGEAWFISFRAEMVKCIRGWKQAIQVFENSFNQFPDNSKAMFELYYKCSECMKSCASDMEAQSVVHQKKGLSYKKLLHNHLKYVPVEVKKADKIDECAVKIPDYNLGDNLGAFHILHPVLRSFSDEFVNKLISCIDKECAIPYSGSVLGLIDICSRTVVADELLFVEFKARALRVILGWKAGVQVYEEESENFPGSEKELNEMCIRYMKDVIEEIHLQEREAFKELLETEKQLTAAGLQSLTSIAVYGEDDEEGGGEGECA